MKKHICSYILSITFIFLLFTGCTQTQITSSTSSSSPTLCTDFDIEGYVPIRVFIPTDHSKAYVLALEDIEDTTNIDLACTTHAQLFVFESSSEGYKAPKPITFPDGFTYGIHMTLTTDGTTLYFSSKNLSFFGNDSINMAYGTLNGTTLEDITALDSINTKEDQYITSIDENKNIIYVSSLSDRYNQIFYSKYNENSYAQPTLMSYHINSSPSLGAALTPDGTKLINTCSYYYDAHLSNYSFIIADLTNTPQTTSAITDNSINPSNFHNMLPTITGDGQTMYFYRFPVSSSTIQGGTLYKVSIANLLAHTLSEYETNPSYDTSNLNLKLRDKGDMATKKGIYYEIFVRAFADSDGDGIGDFNGITEKLDYLKDLGIDGLWLMPINASDTYHGYNVTDYNALNSEYGTEADFKKLLDEAHKRDIKIIMDFVVNHTSSGHPWFQDAITNPNSSYKDYYRFIPNANTTLYNAEDTSPWDSSVWWQVGNSHYYGIFSPHMPDLNLNNPNVRNDIKEAACKWLKLGVDGFRLDAAIHIYGQHEFATQEDSDLHNIEWWNEFARACEEVNPNVYLVGEACEDDNPFTDYVQPFDSKFNFPLQSQLLNALQSETAIADNGMSISQNLQDLLNQYSKVDTNYIDGIFLSNHDQTRIFSSVGSVEKAKLAANIYLTLPGNPYLYYGEEIGMQGLKENGNESLRDNFKWSDTKGAPNANWTITLWNWDFHANDTTIALDKQLDDANSIYNHYKTIIGLRKANPALMDGDYTALTTSHDALLGYTRSKDEQTLSIYHNLSSLPITTTLEKTGTILYRSTESCTLDDVTLTLPAYSTIVINMP